VSLVGGYLQSKGSLANSNPGNLPPIRGVTTLVTVADLVCSMGEQQSEEWDSRVLLLQDVHW